MHAATDTLRTAAMRKPKDPKANRARIIRAARAEFAARGFKGASMDAIAARTDTTRALINYYFGSKEKVYLAVLEEAYAGIRQAEAKLDIEHLEPVAAIRSIVSFTFDYYVANPDFVRIVVAENQAKGVHFRKSTAMRSLNRPIIDTLARVIERGRASGAFARAVDPVQIHMAIAALGMFNMTNQHTFGAIFGQEMGSKGDTAGRCRMIADMVLCYLQDAGSPGLPAGAGTAR